MGYQNILVEDDAKNCFDDLNAKFDDYRWRIDTLCFESKACSLDFNFCSFSWVGMEANIVAHFSVKFVCLKILLF